MLTFSKFCVENLNISEIVVFDKTPVTKTRLYKYIENLQPKTEIFQIKKSDSFHIPAQNIDYGYSLKPPQRGGSNDYPQSMLFF